MAVLILVLVAATYADIPHLRDLAAKLDNPIFVGSAAGASHITSQDTEYNSTLKDQFSLITPENGCKWTATEPQEGKFNFTECDVVFNYSRQYNQAFRGHNLCWGVHNPEWLNGLAGNRSRLEAVLKQHIMMVASRYGGKAYSWDVVNEAVSDNPQGSNYLKTNIWYPTVPNYIDVAFQAASAADPSAKLFYNDYAAEGINAKSDAIYDMVKSMMDRGIPIHGIGLQAHLSLVGSMKQTCVCV
jgi:endo-1,4-beta-xylanase